MKIEFGPLIDLTNARMINTRSRLNARDLIVDCFQCHPSELPEVSWDGTQFRILTDDSSSG